MASPPPEPPEPASSLSLADLARSASCDALLPTWPWRSTIAFPDDAATRSREESPHVTTSTSEIRVDPEYTLELAAELVRIDSVNPSLVEGASGEAEIAAFTAGRMEGLGLEVARHEPEPGRASVVGRLAGAGSGRSLMLNAHYDTVGVEGMDDPFSGRIADGRLHGRGAYDMKASLAAALGAVKALREMDARLAGDLLVAAVADEEHASLGTRDLIGRYDVDGAVVTEPTGLEVCLAHKGFVWLEVETRGRAAHGSDPETGVDANLRMGRVLTGLDELAAELADRPAHPRLGPPSVHAPLLEGGVGTSTYAPRCTLRIERRTLPGETARDVEAEVEAILDRMRAKDPSFEASLETLLERSAFEVGPDAAIVTALEEATTEALGRRPGRTGEGPWMDAAILADAGIETVVFGPAGGGAHADEEWVETDSVLRLAEVLAGTAFRYCGAAS